MIKARTGCCVQSRVDLAIYHADRALSQISSNTKIRFKDFD